MTIANSTADILCAAVFPSVLPILAPSCKRCGATINKFFKSGRPNKFCTACNETNQGKRAQQPQTRPCAQCGAQFAPSGKQKYCCKRCCWTAQDRKAGIAPFVRKAANWFDCEHCGKASHRNISGTNSGPNRWCSMQCLKDAAQAKRPGPFSRCEARYCRTCNKPFITRTGKANCSSECDRQVAREAALAAALSLHRAAAKSVTCDECAGVFCPLYGASHATLCSPCASERAKAMKRLAKAQRKAAARGVNAERVDPLKVFARDKWRCKLCGRATPMRKRATYEDDAPELDHIIPLSKGGPHTYLNTQCACRKCNILKSDKPLGQLLLIG